MSGRCGAGRVEYAFSMKNPDAIAFAERRAAELVTGITSESRAAVRAVITRGLRDGVAPREQARIIREIVGLTERQAKSVMDLRARLAKQGVDTERALSRVSRVARRMLRQRAETIARTETIRASNEGQRQKWLRAKADGLLTGAERRVWIATEDEKTCPTCGALDGTSAPLDGTFADGTEAPPAHPNCRCTTGLDYGRREKAA